MAEPLRIESNVHLEKLLTSDPEMEKEIRAIVSKVLRTAVKEVSHEAARYIQNDPREAYKAVRKMVYKRVLGGNIKILSPRKAGKRGAAPGGSRGRLSRTTDILSYRGVDRSFILRFLDSGTNDRRATYMNGHRIMRENINERPKRRGGYMTNIIGARGRITARGFFGPAAQKAIANAAKEMTVLLEQLYKQRIKE